MPDPIRVNEKEERWWQSVREQFPHWQEVEDARFPKMFQTQPDRLLDDCRRLRDDKRFDFQYLSTISSVDYRDHFEVVYFLYNLEMRRQLGLKVSIDHDRPEVDSVTEIWPTANWNEREQYDLMGIRFRNHPNLRRIYLREDFPGHPLRKDFVDLRPRRHRRVRSH